MQNADCRLDAPGRLQTADCRLKTADSRTATDTPNRHVKFKCQRETRQTTSEQRAARMGNENGIGIEIEIEMEKEICEGWGEGENYLKR